MNAVVTILIVYCLFVWFNLCVFWGDQSRKGYVTAGDLFFILFMSVFGPLSIAAAISALLNGRLEKLGSKRIWERRP